MMDFDCRSESYHSFTEMDRTKLEELKLNWPVPKCESRRLQVLRETKLMELEDDTEVYSRYTNLANRIFKVNIWFMVSV